MLKIHKSHSKKLLLIPITSICITFGLLGFYYLTYTPELSHAETAIYPEKPPIYHPNLFDITYMQDMTEEACQNSYENDTKQLIDKRDNKTYWVTKLKDGNCWMAQNLDLDLTTSGLTKELSDITTDWTSSTNSTYPPVATQTGNPSGFSSTSNTTQGHNLIASFDPGEYVYTKPTNQLSNGCGALNSTTCANAGWQQMTGASTNSSGNELTHYLAGNYYTFNATTAGQGHTKASGTIENSSICPKGWRLPLSKDSNNVVSGSFYYLLNKYGLTSSLANGNNDIRLAPLYFVYGGRVESSSLKYAGHLGSYWSSTVWDASIALNLNFTTSVHPSNTWVRYLGFSVRCVARGEAVVRPVPSVDNVTININQQISLDVADEVVVEKGESNPSTADLKVKVSSNQPYGVNINAKEHAELTSENGDKIPSNGGALTVAENNWGIMKSGDTTYTKVTTTPQLFYQATSPEVKELLLKVGISIAPDLPSGEYSTNITVTATQN